MSQRSFFRGPESRAVDAVIARPAGRARPSGAVTGFSAGTLILTLDGELPVEHLGVGDRVITRSGARAVTGVSAEMVKGAFTVRPHRLGHDRPEATMSLGPGQELLLRDWRARALYRQDQARIPVARLVDGEYITRAAGPLRLFRLEFAQDEVIYAGGLEAAVPASGG
ncbi:Hint domain-containing protein [Frigidibacter sp. ROC022]|uniref:Hint domain-containing protein n=1 Tax=Frigidibacter sp. ROC022 TaxID=2971796 RepID=UPI00215A6782|nr:Hint domain-containing protein [Frigidibacter sp. ROC022]MCR8723607.1 Hint domain-containing protein [Frigidibacter sp. ROC022]